MMSKKTLMIGAAIAAGAAFYWFRMRNTTPKGSPSLALTEGSSIDTRKISGVTTVDPYQTGVTESPPEDRLAAPEIAVTPSYSTTDTYYQRWGSVAIG